MENCEDCVKANKKAQVIGVAVGVALGVGVTFAIIKFGNRS